MSLGPRRVVTLSPDLREENLSAPGLRGARAETDTVVLSSASNPLSPGSDRTTAARQEARPANAVVDVGASHVRPPLLRPHAGPAPPRSSTYSPPLTWSCHCNAGSTTFTALRPVAPCGGKRGDNRKKEAVVEEARPRTDATKRTD